jgi:hypothetical protein
MAAMLGLIATALIVYFCWPGIHWLIGTYSGLAGLLVRLCHRVSAHAEVVVVITSQKAASNRHLYSHVNIVVIALVVVQVVNS